MTLLEHLYRAGLHAERSDQSKLLNGLQRVLGDLPLSVFRSESLLRLLSNAQLRKGRAFNVRQMQQIASPADEQAAFMERLRLLVERRLFQRGYRLRCTECSLEQWHSLEHMTPALRCAGCFAPLPLPLEPSLAYRLNPLLGEVLKSGLLSVILTLVHFDYQDVLWESGIVVQRGSLHTDVDVLIERRDGSLLLVECKDNFHDSAQALQKLREQFLLGQQIAQEIDADFYFSTLYGDAMPPGLNEFLALQDIIVLPRTMLLGVQSPG